ncbi:hypothetical protein O6H91_08G046000 [Diphasiastrum complanatum]|uniref:Uncharacterized protein n=1 Tax=Diphasiastrum complanatum TaxID=34168 RepID=A0ACC2CX30_DIPCM|nr:hypothetical protein O6H91_08G046000 [Diphasiastrum complanatum]
MYLVDWQEIGLTHWELTRCPWWLDYPKGVIPASEEDMHAQFQQIVLHHPTSQDAPAQGSALRRKSAARDIPESSRSRRRLQLHVEDPHEEQVMDIESPLAHASVQEAPNYIVGLFPMLSILLVGQI